MVDTVESFAVVEGEAEHVGRNAELATVLQFLCAYLFFQVEVVKFGHDGVDLRALRFLFVGGDSGFLVSIGGLVDLNKLPEEDTRGVGRVGTY